MPTALTIASTRVHRGIWLLTFEEIPDRIGAEGLRGTRLVLPESNPQRRGRGLLRGGPRRARGARPERRAVGTVSGLEIGPAQDRLVITLTDGVTAYVPFVKRIVPTVADDHVVVDPPPGLFDLYREGTE